MITCAIGIGGDPSSCKRRPCDACRESFIERAAILEYGQGTGGSMDPMLKLTEVPTCKIRHEAEALAREQARTELRTQQTMLR